MCSLRSRTWLDSQIAVTFSWSLFRDIWQTILSKTPKFQWHLHVILVAGSQACFLLVTSLEEESSWSFWYKMKQITVSIVSTVSEWLMWCTCMWLSTNWFENCHKINCFMVIIHAFLICNRKIWAGHRYDWLGKACTTDMNKSHLHFSSIILIWIWIGETLTTCNFPLHGPLNHCSEGYIAGL